MKKAGQIVLIVAGVLSIFACIDYLLSGIFLLIFNNVFREFLDRLEAEGETSYLFLRLEYLVLLYRFATVICFIYAFLCVFYGVLCFVGSSSDSKGFTIMLIAFGVIMTNVGLIGAILKLIAINREEKRKKEAEVIIEK